jgi:hypothetical protein
MNVAIEVDNAKLRFGYLFLTDVYKDLIWIRKR